jgi:DNA-binding transcriptional ArsR family regulator
MQKSILAAQMFKALAHPLRVLMIEKLKGKTWCVTRVASELGVDKSTASKHLSILRDAGIISDSKMGTKVHYSLAAPQVLELAEAAGGAVLQNRRRRLDLAR